MKPSARTSLQPVVIAAAALTITLLVFAQVGFSRTLTTVKNVSFTGPAPSGAVARLGKGAVQVLALSPDGSLLAVGGNAGAFLYHARTLREVWSLSSSEPVSSQSISPDNTLVAVGLQDGTLVLLNAADGKVLYTLISSGDVGVQSLAWTPGEVDGEIGYLLATGFNDGRLLVSSVRWMENQLSVVPVGQLDRDIAGITALSFSPNNRILASGNRGGLVNLWDPLTATWIGVLIGHKPAHAVLSLKWSPDGEQLLSGGRDAQEILWDLGSFSPQRTLSSHEDEVLDMSFSPGGVESVSVGRDGALTTWKTSGERLTYQSQQFSSVWIAAALSRYGTILAAVSQDGEISVWDLRAAGQVPTATLKGFLPPDVWVPTVVWSPDRDNLASASGDEVWIWNTKTGQRLQILTGHQRPVTSVAWSRDGKRIASASKDRTVIVWDANTGKRLLTLIGHGDNVADVTWSPDGSRLASAGSLDNRVIIWNAITGD